MRYRPYVAVAWLTPASNGGPDAWIETTCEKRISLQITLAGTSQQSYFSRLTALQDAPYFPYQMKSYDARHRIVRASGRALQAPKQIVDRHVSAVVSGIRNKRLEFPHTDTLLVASEHPVLPKRLRNAVKKMLRLEFMRRCSHIRFRNVIVLLGYSTIVLNPKPILANSKPLNTLTSLGY